MKTRNLIKVSTICFAFFQGFSTLAGAQGKLPDQTGKKADGNSKMSEHGEMMEKGMMGKMDEKHMMNMMNQCMGKQNDGKICDQQVMAKCEKDMDSQACMKMMNDSKKQIKATKN